jgi:hypothetical protein
MKKKKQSQVPIIRQFPGAQTINSFHFPCRSQLDPTPIILVLSVCEFNLSFSRSLVSTEMVCANVE